MDDDDDDNDGDDDIPSLQIRKATCLCRAEIYFDSKAHIFFSL